MSNDPKSSHTYVKTILSQQKILHSCMFLIGAKNECYSTYTF